MQKWHFQQSVVIHRKSIKYVSSQRISTCKWGEKDEAKKNCDQEILQSNKNILGFLVRISKQQDQNIMQQNWATMSEK